MLFRLLLCISILTLMPLSSGLAKGTLRIGISQYPVNLNPMFTTHLAASYVLGFTKTPLVIYNHNWQPECRLCTELPSFENGRLKKVTQDDGYPALDIHYTLHQEARWSDGTPVTTRDVLFSWEVGKNAQTGVTTSQLYQEDISDVRVIDDKNFIIRMNKRLCNAAILSGFHILPAHIEQKQYKQEPEKYRERSLYTLNPDTKGLYNGPYVIVDVNIGSQIVLERNPEWWGKTPQFDRITLKIIENTTALTANLLAGEIDIISGELGLPLDQALALEKRLERSHKNKFDVLYKQGLIYEHIDLNLDNPIFQDVKTRQALLHSIDRAAISEQIFGGKQAIAHTNIHPLDTYYNADIHKYAYAPEIAKDLFAQAGWRIGPDNILINDKGQKLSFDFLTTAGNQSRELVQQAIQANWKEVGVQTRIKNQPPRVLFGETARKRATQGAIMYAWLSAPGTIPNSTLHSSRIPSAENTYVGQNYVGYKNPALDQILDDLEVKCEKEQQHALWASMQHIYADDLPALPLYYRANAFFIPKWLKGISPTGHQFPSSLWVTEWSTTQ